MIHVFERGDEGAHILAPPLQVEHDIGHALAGPVIGVFAAAPGAKDRKPVRIDQVLGVARWCRRCRAADVRPARPVRSACPSRIASARASIDGERLRVGRSGLVRSAIRPGRAGQGSMERRGELAACWHGGSRCDPHMAAIGPNVQFGIRRALAQAAESAIWQRFAILARLGANIALISDRHALFRRKRFATCREPVRFRPTTMRSWRNW